MKTTSKKTLLKRGIAVLLAFSMIITMQGAMNFSAEASAENDVTTETVAKETVLFESNYDDVTTASDVWGGFSALSNQMYPKKEGENGYIYYAQSTQAIGVLRLGHSYTHKALTGYTPITVTPGQTYIIEFDYRLKPYLDTTKYPVWPNADLAIGVAVGSASTSLDGVTSGTYFDSHTSYYEEIEVLAKAQTQPDVDWTHKQVTVTIPQYCDVSTYNALQLYATNGQRCGLHIDNIKVTTAELVTSETLFESEYDEALVVSDIHGGFQPLSNNLYPTSEVVGGVTNKYLSYRQSTTAIGVVRLGHDYKTKEVTNINYIKVAPGITYEIEFDLRVQLASIYTGDYAKETWPKADLIIGVAVGGSYLDLSSGGTNVVNGPNAYRKLTSYSEQEVVVAKESNPNTDWVKKKINFTVPKDCDVTTYDALQLYVTNGQWCQVDFDNIKITTVISSQPIRSSDTVLIEDDYSDAIAKTDIYGGFQPLSNNLYPTSEVVGGTTNKYLSYRQSTTNIGVVRLGHDYKTKEVTNINYIKVTPGVTYEIEFDLRVQLASIYTGENAKETWPNDNLIIGVAVGGAYLDLSKTGTNAVTGPNAYRNLTSHYEQEVVVTKGDNPNTGWEKKSITFTVPTNCDVTTYDALQLYVTNGQWCQVDFDNIKITELAGVNVSHDVDGDVSNVYNSDGNISYNAMLDANSNAMKWYTDEARTTAFISSDYVRTRVLDTVSLYGLKDTSLAAFIKGDADGDGTVEDDDISLMRKGILGTDVTYPSRTDIDDSGALDVRDLVRSKKTMNSINMTANVTVGGSALSSYKVEMDTALAETTIVKSRATAIESLGHMSGTNPICVALNTAMANNLYIVEVKKGAVRIEGGSENAIAAALEAVIGYIKAGVSIDSADSMEFIYNGKAYTDYATLVYNENF